MTSFYHQTTSERWNEIQEEGILWGRPGKWSELTEDNYRYTYLSPILFFGECPEKFDILLEVDYEPVGVDGTRTDNFGFNPPKDENGQQLYCLQFSVFIPISLDRVKRIDYKDVPAESELLKRSLETKCKRRQ